MLEARTARLLSNYPLMEEKAWGKNDFFNRKRFNLKKETVYTVLSSL